MPIRLHHIPSLLVVLLAQYICGQLQIVPVKGPNETALCSKAIVSFTCETIQRDLEVIVDVVVLSPRHDIVWTPVQRVDFILQRNLIDNSVFLHLMQGRRYDIV